MNTTVRRLTGGWVLALCLVGVESRAAGFRNPPESASGLGAVGARMTWVEDPSALSFNPANVAYATEPGMMMSLSMVGGRAEFQSPDGRKGRTTGSAHYLPNVHAVWPRASGWTPGLALTTPYGQSTVWRADGPFRYLAPHRADMTTISVAPAVAVALNDQWAVGVTAAMVWSELELRQRVPWALQTGVPGLPDGEVRLKGDGYGLGGSVGLTWNPTLRQRMALVYKAPFTVDYEGSTRIGSVPPPLSTAVAARSTFESTIRFPSMVSGGYGVRVTEAFRVGVDIEWIEFSRFRSLPLDVGANNPMGLVPGSVPQDWKDTWTVGLGVEWDRSPAWTVRGGYQFLESPIPSSTMAPTLPDADRHLVSIGLGYTRARHTVDIAYAYTFFRDRTVTEGPVPAYFGTYDLSSQLLHLSYRRDF